MFPVKTYVSRRAELRAKTGGGLILLPGNQPSANNYPNNAYYFRQDSTFLYYFGLDRPSLAGVIDADTGEEVLFGDDFTVDDIIWTGPQPTLREEGARAGVADCRPLAALADYLAAAIRLGRRIHYLPPYRGETKLQLSALLGIAPALLHDYKSVDLMFAVAEMREVKSAEEVAQMEDAFHIGYAMHTTAMRMCRAGVVEREIAGAIEGVAKSMGLGVSFPSIVSQHGETLHNLNSEGVLADGRLLLVDAGGENRMNYCSDHTRTYPVSGRFTAQQREIYDIVLACHDHIARIVRPGMMYMQEVHLESWPRGSSAWGCSKVRPTTLSPRAPCTSSCPTDWDTGWAWTCTTAKTSASAVSTIRSWPSAPRSRLPASTAPRGVCARGRS